MDDFSLLQSSPKAFFRSLSMGVKLIMVCGLALLMTIPAFFVSGLVDDRTKRADASEVQSIFWLLRVFLRLETDRLLRRGVRLQAIGRRDRLPKSVLHEIDKAESATAAGKCLHLCIAVDYSSRNAITRAAVGVNAALSNEGLLSPDVLQPLLSQALTMDGGEVDLLIRTGGEKRLSDFLLWESAYTELLFTDRMWPEFDEDDLDASLEEFKRREKRFGSVPTVRAPSFGGIQ